MLNLDPAKLFVILVVALIVLGPERLPRAARQLGSAWRELTKVREQLTEEVRSSLPDVDIPRIPYRAGTVSRFLGDLSRPRVAEVSGPDSSERQALSQSGPSHGDEERQLGYWPLDEVAPGSDDPSMN